MSMVLFIGGLIVALGAIGVIVVSKETGGKGAGAFGIVVALVLIGLSCLTIVPAQNIGVITQFSKPTGENLGAGLSTKAPWQKVSDMDGTIQLLNKSNDKADSKDGSLIKPVSESRMNVTNSKAYVTSNLRWRIVPEAAPTLFVDWKKGSGDIVGEKIANNLVDKQLQTAINNVMDSYDPLLAGSLSTEATTVEKLEAQSNAAISEQVTAELKKAIGSQIEIVSFAVTQVDYDEKTQQRIDLVQAEVSKTRAAEQAEKTAAAQSRANKALSESVSKDPNVLVSKCLDTFNKMVDAGQPVPPAFTCWPANAPQTVTPTR